MQGAMLLAVLAGAGYCAWRMTGSSLAAEAQGTGGPVDGAVGMVESLAEAAVDPQNIRSDRGRFPLTHSEPGPFGITRNVHHDTGNTLFYTHGAPTLGLHGV